MRLDVLALIAVIAFTLIGAGIVFQDFLPDEDEESTSNRDRMLDQVHSGEYVVSFETNVTTDGRTYLIEDGFFISSKSENTSELRGTYSVIENGSTLVRSDYRIESNETSLQITRDNETNIVEDYDGIEANYSTSLDNGTSWQLLSFEMVLLNVLESGGNGGQDYRPTNDEAATYLEHQFVALTGRDRLELNMEQVRGAEVGVGMTPGEMPVPRLYIKKDTTFQTGTYIRHTASVTETAR